MLKNKRNQTILCGLGFACVFLIVLTLVTLLFYPKRITEAENNQVSGFYNEPENTIDVLFLGSCNMYSSFNPVLFYEEHGVTSFVMACPDQEMMTSYHYLKEALKTQQIKTVVVESLFLTCKPTAKREYYNRLALDYMPMSLNKLSLMSKIVEQEVSIMKEFDPTAPGKVLSWGGYLFPLLRYHGRDDLTREDITFFLENEQYTRTKGAVQGFSYTTNDNNYFAYVKNGTEIRDISEEYFLKIRDLCEENGIDLVLIKSPNNYRWDEEASAAVAEFALKHDLNYLDFQKEEYGFADYDYANSTGRLNVYGMKKLTKLLGDYLVKNVGLEPTQLNAEAKAEWDSCVRYVYENARNKGYDLAVGQIAQISNEKNGICIRWNACSDAQTYEIWRCEGKDGQYAQIGVSEGVLYVDETAEAGKGYSYYVVPQQGSLQGQTSEPAYYVFVATPENVNAVNADGRVFLSWDKAAGAQKYYLQRKFYSNVAFEYWDSVEKTSYTNVSCDQGSLYFYRLRAIHKEGDETYYSDSVIVQAIPMETPVIAKQSSGKSGNTITWNSLNAESNRPDKVEIWRMVEGAEAFELYDTVKEGKTTYTDENVESGVQYFYKIVAVETTNGHTERSAESNTVGIVTK